VQFDKAQIIELLRSQGQQDQAAQADGELPQQVDTEQHAGLLEKFGLTPEKVIAMLAGGGLGGALGGGQQGEGGQQGGGGIGGALGGLLGGR
jgi:hypothetical protein